MDEIMRNSFIMLGKAFCGNGFIHLNIAEIHEEDIGGQKKRAPIGDQASKSAIFGRAPIRPMNFLKRRVAIDQTWREARVRSWVERGLRFAASTRIGLGLAAGD